jgi:excisionase family DNA binding protein
MDQIAGTLATRDDAPEYLTLKEAARLCRRAPRTLREWRRDGLLKTHRIGRAKLIKLTELLQAMEAE